MQERYRLYKRNNGTFYAEDCETAQRTSLNTKSKPEAQRLLAGKNQAFSQPVFNMEMAKVYLRAQDPEFCSRTWETVARLIEGNYDGPTRRRWQKFIRSGPAKIIGSKALVQTTAADFLTVLTHSKAGVSTNVFLRILHNRALDMGWLLHPVLSRKSWPKIRYKKRRAITIEEHQKILSVTQREDYRLFFSLLWETGGSQTDIASLHADHIDWDRRRLYYERAKLKTRNMGDACIAIGPRLELLLEKLPKKGALFPQLIVLGENERASYFWKQRKKAGLEEGLTLHCYRYAWAERAQAAGMPEREAMAHLGHGSKAVHRAYARSADRVTLPLEFYEKQAVDKLVQFRAELGSEQSPKAGVA